MGGMNSMFTVIPFSLLLLLLLSLPLISAQSLDASVMAELRKSLKLPKTIDWSASDPCQWYWVLCGSNGRVTRIQLGNLGVSGTLPSTLSNLTYLQVLELMDNQISGPLPSLAGLSSLQTLNLTGNRFSSIPSDFFQGMTSLQSVYLDHNPFSAWSIPVSLQDSMSLLNFSANNANVVGSLPEFIGPETFPSLAHLRLMANHLEGGLPASFSGLTLQSLWLSGQNSTNGSRSLGGSIDVLQNMTEIVQVWLNLNSFRGPIPDLTMLDNLVELNLRHNSLTGPVPASLTALKSLQIVNLSHNFLQGPTPLFHGSVAVDLAHGTNSFCLSKSGAPCDSRVNALISFLETFDYPLVLAENWNGNDPCSGWVGISCGNGNITVVNLQGMGLSGSISAAIAKLTSVQVLDLARNNITGTIPNALTTMPNLKKLDVSYNNLYGVVPAFGHTNVITTGNVNIGKDAPPSSSGDNNPGSSVTSKNSSTRKVVGIVVVLVVLIVVIGLVVLWFIWRTQKKVSDRLQLQWPNGLDVIEVKDSLVISIQALRNVTNNFSENNVLGKGGFGTVYKGELHDGTEIAVKRMHLDQHKVLAEFTYEISVLTKVRHKNLVSLVGYCLDRTEKILVYEYMPQGDLSKHLFRWKACGLQPLEWKQRLAIALDVARGVEYLHNLAHQSFIHRDLKPSNILLGDDMRAKVSDFGLVRLVPNGGKASIQTTLAGTFGYLAPEYAVNMRRLTMKVDVYSFGVILMELITGRKALDETQSEDSMHLETWFRRIYIDRDSLLKFVDPTVELNEETGESINTIAELAGHCCAENPQQRPEMGHAVNVISSMVEFWQPSTEDSEDCNEIDLQMNIPQSLNFGKTCP